MGLPGAESLPVCPIAHVLNLHTQALADGSGIVILKVTLGSPNPLPRLIPELITQG